MNAVSGFLSCLYNNQSSCLPEEMPNQRVVTVALVGLGFLGMSYLCQYKNKSLFGRAVEKQPKLFFKALEELYLKMYPTKIPFWIPSLEQDAPYMKSLLEKWTITSQMHFFYFLGLNIYQDCKNENMSEKDLNKFCAVYQKLCNETAVSLKTPIDDKILRDFESLREMLPKKALPGYLFVLKILMYPEVALILGKMQIKEFEQNEILDGGFTRREDVQAFLDFASHLYPEELGFIGKNHNDTALSSKLNDVLRVMQRDSNFKNDQLQINCYQFITSVKWIVDYRLLEKTVPTERFLANIEMFDELLHSDNAHWFKKKIKEYAKNSDNAIQRLNSTLKSHKIINNCNREIYVLILITVNKISIKSLKSLEDDIKIKLQNKRKICTPDAYAIIFADMIRFYQIAHDVCFLKDATKDQLEGQHIPDSLTDLAFLPEIKVANEVEQTLPGQLQTLETPKYPLPCTTPDSSDKECYSQSKSKVKTRPERINIGEEKGTPPPTSDFTLFVMEKPDFPMRNVSGATAMYHLLNNGFIIKGVKGSHYQMHHVVSHVKLTVPYHESLKPGTLHSIRRGFYLSQGYNIN